MLLTTHRPDQVLDGLLGELITRQMEGRAEEPSALTLPSEAEELRAALLRNGRAVGRTAADLGISRTTLWRKLKQYGIRP